MGVDANKPKPQAVCKDQIWILIALSRNSRNADNGQPWNPQSWCRMISMELNMAAWSLELQAFRCCGCGGGAVVVVVVVIVVAVVIVIAVAVVDVLIAFRCLLFLRVLLLKMPMTSWMFMIFTILKMNRNPNQPKNKSLINVDQHSQQNYDYDHQKGLTNNTHSIIKMFPHGVDDYSIWI